MVSKEFWGLSLHLNLHGCNKSKLSKDSLKKYCSELCKEIGMKKFGKTLVERFGSGKLEGNSALQFIETSSISIHADECYDRVFVDIFSCKKFDTQKAEEFSKEFFESNDSDAKCLIRK